MGLSSQKYVKDVRLILKRKFHTGNALEVLSRTLNIRCGDIGTRHGIFSITAIAALVKLHGCVTELLVLEVLVHFQDLEKCN